ncbi:hypothetical protein CWB85_20430 [Pseudoalteromonas sp. S1727]|uniref:hypothetical protein n=1 Tax=Pseudoalteromonas sp. S1727 TaxID=2066514 RepID=UPI0011086921|nr:hypothetical protein [Pseudoalteromonas sp. S1727]TMN66301.1 hypothetical protein CWB85_20430 [Pseudoalteromonas sp. S1727]
MKLLSAIFACMALSMGSAHATTDCEPGQKTTQACIDSIKFKNSDFYDASGVFLKEKAKDAILALLNYHGYPVFDGIREKIFVMDYNSGNFLNVGLSGLMYENNQTNLYMLLDIFLLPNQMLAEHWHVDGETTAAKREGWLVRWGKSYIAGIGENNMADHPEVTIPKIHWDGKVSAQHIEVAEPGDFLNLKQVLSPHWQMAGNEGAIITEVANFADGKAVKRSDPKMN